MEIVILGLVGLAVVSGLAARLSRNSKRQSCCIIVDPARDLRMASAFETKPTTDV